MDDKAGGFFAVFLNYGGLGVLALLCVIVLGYNAKNLNDLVRDGAPEKLVAARPLLLTQMGISLLGLLLAGGAAVYLAIGDQNLKRVQDVQLLLDPWDDPLDAKYRPHIRIGDHDVPPVRLISVPCKAGAATNLIVDIDPYVRYRVDAGAKNRALLTAPDAP